MDEVRESILNNDITLVVTTPLTRTLFIINLLNELSIKDKYRTFLYGVNIRCEYYFHKLISNLSGISRQLISKYYYPYISLSKNSKEKINRDKFIDAIEKIQDSKILISNNIISLDEIDMNDVLIIDNFNMFLDKTMYDLDEMIEILKRKKKGHLVLFINRKNKEDNKILKKYDEYIDNYIYVDGFNYLDYKDIFIRIKNGEIDKNIKLKFDKNNRNIEDMEWSNE